MKSELVKISNSVSELQITITKAEFDLEFNKRLNTLKKQIKMPGFRPGKVPAKLVVQMYGKSIELEAEEALSQEEFKSFIDKNNPNIIGQPVLKDINTEPDGNVKCTVSFEVMPEFELKDYKSLEIYEPYHKVTDEEVDKQLNFIAVNLGEHNPEAQNIENYNAKVTVDAYTFNIETEEIIQPEPHTQVLDLFNIREEDNLRDKFLNKKLDAEVLYYPPDDKKFGQKLVIKKIDQIVPKPLDDELAKTATNGKFDNLEDFKQEIGFNIQKQWDDKTNELMHEQIVSKVTELHEDIELPEVLLQNAHELVIQTLKKEHPSFDASSPHMHEYVHKLASKRVRIEMVKEAIIKKEKLEVEQYDLENFVDEFIEKYAKSEASPMFDRNTLIAQIQADENLKRTLLDKKYIDFLLDFTKTIEIDYDEYIEKNIPKETDITAL